MISNTASLFSSFSDVERTSNSFWRSKCPRSTISISAEREWRGMITRGALMATFKPMRVPWLWMDSTLNITFNGTSIGKIHRKMHHNFIRPDEGQTLETSPLEKLYGGQFLSSIQLTEPNYLGIFSNNAAPQLLQQPTPLCVLTIALDQWN